MQCASRITYTCGMHNRNTLQLCHRYKARGKKCVTKGSIWICTTLSPSIKITLEIRRATFGRATKAIKKSSPRLSSWTIRDWRYRWCLISSCAINDSDKCVKTAIVVIETRDTTLHVFAPSLRYVKPGEKGLVARAPLEISNLFHFKVPALIDAREKVTTNARRIRTVTYRMEKWHVWGGLRRVTLLPTSIVYATRVFSRQVARHPLPSSRTLPYASLRDTDIRGVAEVVRSLRNSQILRIWNNRKIQWKKSNNYP